MSRKVIDLLFSSTGSRKAVAFPVKAVYYIDNVREESAVPAVRVLMSVPKRYFKHAVDRNRVKRQLREAYRLNKNLLTSAVPEGKSVSVAFVFLSDRHWSSAEITARVVSLLMRISKEL